MLNKPNNNMSEHIIDFKKQDNDNNYPTHNGLSDTTSTIVDKNNKRDIKIEENDNNNDDTSSSTTTATTTTKSTEDKLKTNNENNDIAAAAAAADDDDAGLWGGNSALDCCAALFGVAIDAMWDDVRPLAAVSGNAAVTRGTQKGTTVATVGI